MGEPSEVPGILGALAGPATENLDALGCQAETLGLKANRVLVEVERKNDRATQKEQVRWVQRMWAEEEGCSGA